MAVADPAQIGMDWGTTGYRGFVPDLEKGALPTTRENSTTYDTGVDKVGQSQSFKNCRKVEVQFQLNLLYSDESGKDAKLELVGANAKCNELQQITRFYEEQIRKSQQPVTGSSNRNCVYLALSLSAGVAESRIAICTTAIVRRQDHWS